MFDVIIIGAGPAGLAAAIYCARRVLKTLVIAKDVGGQANMAEGVENYPGILSMSGFGLMMKMKEQADSFGAEFRLGEVVSIKKDGAEFVVKTNTHEEKTKVLIIASGLVPRDLGVPGEEKFKGKGVSYCAICDGPFFKKKIVAVVGGGNSAIEAALYLSKIAKKVYLVHRREGFRGDESSVCRLKETKKIELVLNAVVSEVLGDDYVSAIKVSDVNTKAEREIKLDGVFVEIGRIARIEWFKDLVKLNERNEIITDKNGKTSEPGIFAAGDITDTLFKQIVISAGEGARAALSADAYLHPIGGKPNSELKPFDWGRCRR